MNTADATAAAREVLALRRSLPPSPPSLDRGLRVAVFLLTWFFLGVLGVVLGGAIGSGPGASVGLVIGVVPGFFIALWAANVVRVAAQWERAVVLRLGRFGGVKGPGLIFVFPVLDNVQLIDTAC